VKVSEELQFRAQWRDEPDFRRSQHARPAIESKIIENAMLNMQRACDAVLRQLAGHRELCQALT